MNKNNHINSNKMNKQTNYGPFNRRKNYRKHVSNKTIHINHYHMNESRDQRNDNIEHNPRDTRDARDTRDPKFPIMNKNIKPNFVDEKERADQMKERVDRQAKEMIDKFSLNKPVIPKNIQVDRYTPVPEFIFRRRFNTDEKDEKDDDKDNDKDESEDENENSLEINESELLNNRKMISIITRSANGSPNFEVLNIFSPTNEPLRDNIMKYADQQNKMKDEQERLEKQEKLEKLLQEKKRLEEEKQKQEEIKKKLQEEIFGKIKEEIASNYEFEEILFDTPINHITDLIELANKYKPDVNKKYSIDIEKLHKIVPFLTELNEMIGMNDIKVSLAHQLMYFLQGFEYKHMLHTIIEGPPGVGKTCLGKILGRIYLELGVINNAKPEDAEEDDDERGQMSLQKLFSHIIARNEKKEEKPKLKFKIAKRSDLVGQYVGHTAVKTQKIINESFGGVLFIDEAYSLGADDAFSRECINTINQNLSENGDKFICIIAGYSDALESNFFSYNSGLHRRFPFRYKIEKYTGAELSSILKKKIEKEKFQIDSEFETKLEKFIEENKDNFPNFGGDIETYFFHIKMMHAKRVFGKPIKLRNIFTDEDMKNALSEMKKNQKEEEKCSLEMYI